MDFLPLFFKLQEKHCLVVGGGAVALRKASLLLRSGGKVFVVAETLSAEMKQFVQQHALGYREGAFVDNDLNNMQLVIAATDDESLNARVSQLAQQRQILVNVVDNPALCSFILPAIVDRSPVIVAVSSGGQSPVLARLLRARLESVIPAAYGRLALLMGRYRDVVKNSIKGGNQRRGFWESVLQGPIAELVFAGKEQQAESLLQQ
ncbi:MAG TPA: NAD(P)-dependent oxidoreductase, partial [Pseudomonadales bacterium]|nr:NAD(P)-dependent oxidoreductase [Pseudomonadales bacterium]